MIGPVAPDAVVITAIAVPESVDSDDAADFRAAIEIRNRVGETLRGEDAVAVRPEQSLPLWHEQTDEEIHGWLVRVGGELAGRALLHIPLEAGSRRAQISVELLPQWQGRGIGRQVLPFVEERARERGRSVLQTWTEHPARAGRQIAARTGFGAVPADRAARFLTAAGYALEQVYRISTLRLDDPSEGIERVRTEAIDASSGYRFVSWSAPTPPEWIEDYAWMKSRMSTDAPSGETEMDEEAWDAARVRRMESTNAAVGFDTLVGAAQHIASGRLVAFTELMSFHVPGKPIDQNDTLVLAEHRGHRLGALVKCETLALARTRFAESDRIVTGNAEENRPMLAVNEAMGFAPTRYSGDWQKIG